MRRRSLFAAAVVVALAAATAAAFGLLRPAGAVGAAKPTTVVGTLQIEGLTAAGQPIDVLAYSWGVSNSGTGANIQDLSFTKSLDTLSPQIVHAVVAGDHFASATLLVNATGVAGASTHRYTFNDVTFSSDSHGGSGGERLTENVTIHFASFQFENVS